MDRWEPALGLLPSSNELNSYRRRAGHGRNKWAGYRRNKRAGYRRRRSQAAQRPVEGMPAPSPAQNVTGSAVRPA